MTSIRPAFINALFLYEAINWWGLAVINLNFIIVFIMHRNEYHVATYYISEALYYISNRFELQWYRASQLLPKNNKSANEWSSSYSFTIPHGFTFRFNFIIWGLQIFQNMNYIINTDAVANNWCGQWMGNKVLIKAYRLTNLI